MANTKFWSIGQDTNSNAWQVRSLIEGQPLTEELIEEYLGTTLLDAAMDFDGYFEEDSETGEITKVSDNLPRLFVITATGDLYTRILHDAMNLNVLLDTDVVKVAARRSWRFLEPIVQDWGFVVAYIKDDGSVWVREGIDVEGEGIEWRAAQQIDAGPATQVQVVRLKDLRTGVVVTKNTSAELLVTSNTPYTSGLGIALTQEEFDEITPEIGKYYAIFPSAAGQAITDAVHCTRAEYEALTPNASTLYLIEENNEYLDIRFGESLVIKWYLGFTLNWKRTNLVVAMSDPYFWTEGNYNAQGELSPSTTAVYSPLLDADTAITYVWRCYKAGADLTTISATFVAYDANGQYIGGATASSVPNFGAMRSYAASDPTVWTPPNGTRYIRVCTIKCDYFLFANLADVNVFLPFTDSSWAQDKYLSSDGSLSTGSNYATSDYIPIPDGVNDFMWAFFAPNPTGELWSAFILYDANKTRIDSKRPAGTSSNWFAVTTPLAGMSPAYNSMPSNAKYIRISVAKCPYTCCLTDRQIW